MKIEIKSVKDRGTVKERIIFVAKEDCDIGHFFVFSSKKIAPNRYSSDIKDPFWFPDKQIKEHDLIVLYTKKGASSVKSNPDNTTSHFYYRLIENPIIEEDTAIILLESNVWSAL